MLRIPIQVFYTVRPGDTVYQIARRWEIPLETLIAANQLEPPYTIYVGQQLSIPPGVTLYRVKPGDTVFRIAQLYGVPSSLIIEANNLTAPFVIYPDQLLYIPPGVPYYIVQPGDTLFLIALRYQVTTSGHSNPEFIRDVNQLQSFTIYPGMRLLIPYAPPGETGLIAYTSNQGGNYDIWLYQLRNGTHAQLTNGLGDSFSVPYWSHDSNKIAFVGKNQIIYVLNLLTGEIAKIDQLVEGDVHTLDWATDNRRLAYAKQNQIYIYDTHSHQVRKMPQQGVRDVQWFPNSMELLYQAPDAKGISQLFRMKVDGSERKQVTQNQQGPLNHVRLSPDGQLALYTTPGASISIIYIVDVNSGNLIEVKGGPLAKNYHPTWAPNSNKIAYSATAFPERGYFSLIRTVGSQGENDRTRTISDCFSTPVSWSPDSNKIVYLSGCRGQSYATEIWYLDLNNPVPKQLVKGGRITSVKWSSKAIPIPKRTYTNLLYKVRFQYPLNWLQVTPERYEGEDGFFQISAISAEGSTLEEVCHNEAFHSLLPYGSQPRIFTTTIKKQEACFIFPSFDQPAEMKRQAAVIIRYPVPIQIDGTTYQFFILWAKNEHIDSLSSTIEFLS